jgi:hypothetical protein
MEKRCQCERKKLDPDGVCKRCGGRTDLDREQFATLAVAMMRWVEGERPQRLVRVGGRKRPI